MPKSKRETTIIPSEATLGLLEPAIGIAEATDKRLEPIARELLALSQDEQIAAAHWMGSQPQYAALLGYLVVRAGVTGAVRRAVKRAIFELNRQGIAVPTVTETLEEPEPAVDTSSGWMVQQVYAACHFWHSSEQYVLFHFRFFLQQPLGERCAFLIDLHPAGYLDRAQWVEDGMKELYEECVNHPLIPNRPDDSYDPQRPEFVPVPADWALQVVHEARQRSLRDHRPMPAHAAYYWGRLPEPPHPPVPNPVDSIADVETGWLLSPLVDARPHLQFSRRLLDLLVYYAPSIQETAGAMRKVMEETESRLVLSPQAEEERKKRSEEKLLQELFSDESLREPLLFTLPIHGSILLLGGDRTTAVLCKALWRELNERRDRPLWQTEFASLTFGFAYLLLASAAGIDISSVEGGENAPITTQP